MATDLTEADDMIEACEQGRGEAGHQPPAALAAPNSGRSGNSSSRAASGSCRAIHDRGKNRQGGYEMMEIGTHLFDAMQFFAGGVRSVYGHLTTERARHPPRGHHA